ncbi:hypothetical protein [Dokdonella sp.]|uniref:hypothetical protein n=1 Tax=Dokdonella sp. TaxID=2291710 RepID=UPI00352727AD
MAIVCRPVPQAQNRLTVAPGTLTGKPARMAIWRAMLRSRAFGPGAAISICLDCIDGDAGTFSGMLDDMSAGSRHGSC